MHWVERNNRFSILHSNQSGPQKGGVIGEPWFPMVLIKGMRLKEERKEWCKGKAMSVLRQKEYVLGWELKIESVLGWVYCRYLWEGHMKWE